MAPSASIAPAAWTGPLGYPGKACIERLAITFQSRIVASTTNKKGFQKCRRGAVMRRLVVLILSGRDDARPAKP